VTFNELATRVETGLVRFKSPEGRTCLACITDGAVVIDCVNYDNCDTIEIIVDQDVNSISLPNCDNDIKKINFFIPPGTTRKICGWPSGSGFNGDECFRAPVSGGTNGRTMSAQPNRAKTDAKASGSQPGTPARFGSPSATCNCVPGAAQALKIQSCNANNSVKCSTTKSLTAIACGGIPPYLWSVSGGTARFKEKVDAGHPDGLHTSVTGSKVVIVPPANAGSAVAGVAYTKSINGVACNGTCPCGFTEARYGCDDVFTVCSATPICAVGTNPVLAYMGTDCGSKTGRATSGCAAHLPTVTCSVTCAAGTECACAQTNGGVSDCRTAPMIAANCTPCALVSGTTISVTDAAGTVVSIILRA